LAVEPLVRIAGTALPLRGNNIDTDRIIPARFLKSVTFDGLETHLFEDDRRALEESGGSHPVSTPAYAGASLMLVNANFGCGSSREHAPQAIRRRGIRAVIGESYSEIFFGNSVALGLPCVSAPPATLDAVMSLVERDPASELVLDLSSMTLAGGGERFTVELPAGVREAFIDGSWDATGLLLADFSAVEAVAARLPYVSGNWDTHN